MASSSSKDTLPIAAFFSNLLHNLPRLMLTNLLFAVPLGAFGALFRLLSRLTPADSLLRIVVQLLAVIPLFPFYAGVVKVTAKMAAGEEKVPVAGCFFGAVRDNLLPFLLHGTVYYVVTVFSFVSLSTYIGLIGQNLLFTAPLVMTGLIILLFVFLFFYLPAMTVTYDIPLKYLYKNSLLMSYGELKNNFTALVGLFFLTVLATTCLMACYGSPVAVVIVTVILAAVFVPALAAFIIHSAVFEKMCRMIDAKGAQTAPQADRADRQQGSEEQDREAFRRAVQAFELDETLPDDAYVYFNGKMVRAGTVRKLKQEAEGGDDPCRENESR